MTTMTSRNPYVAPRAAVTDAAEEFQPVRLFAVAGRIGRARYIVYTICLPFILMFVAGAASALLGNAGIAVIVVGWIATVVLSFMLSIQRSHDFNMSGWFALLVLVPLANLAFWFVPGTDGANRYGPKAQPNSLGVLIGVWLVPALFVAGIVAAVSIPAYQEYAQRTELQQRR